MATPTPEPRTIAIIYQGSEAGQHFRFTLPGDYATANVRTVVEFALNRPGMTREEQYIAGLIRREMVDKFGFTINAQSAKPEEDFSKYVKKQEVSGVPYFFADIIVSKHQTQGAQVPGGLERTLG